MSIDLLQTKMKKLNNTLMVNFSVGEEVLPEQVVQAHEDFCDVYADYCAQLLTGLKGEAAAIRCWMPAGSLLRRWPSNPQTKSGVREASCPVTVS